MFKDSLARAKSAVWDISDVAMLFLVLLEGSLLLHR